MFILDKQASSMRGAARTALALVHANHPEIVLEYCTAGALEDCDEVAIYAQIQGLDNRVVRMIDHGTFYDKQPLTPVNIKRQCARLLKEEAQRRKGAEPISEGAEQSDEGSDQAPSDGETAKEDSEASTLSPSAEAPSKQSGSQGN